MSTHPLNQSDVGRTTEVLLKAVEPSYSVLPSRRGGVANCLTPHTTSTYKCCVLVVGRTKKYKTTGSSTRRPSPGGVRTHLLSPEEYRIEKN